MASKLISGWWCLGDYWSNFKTLSQADDHFASNGLTKLGQMRLVQFSETRDEK